MSNAMAKDSAARIEAYWKMNGSKRLTPRQRRRVVRKHNHALAPFDESALHRHAKEA